MVSRIPTRELRAVEGARLWAKAPLAPFTTIAAGGRAALLVTVATPQALSQTIGIVESAGVPWLCMGAGSNLLIADHGYSGVVIKLDDTFHYLDGLPHQGTAGEAVLLTAGGGSFLSRLSAVVAENGLSGLEFACGIPGSLGGGVRMNAGAYGRNMVDVVEALELTSTSGTRWVAKEDLEWGYRFCRLPEGSVVTAARLLLTAGDAENILEEQRALLRQRRQAQPRGARTFGSVFKNPPGQSAWRLLDEAGLRGVRRGGAEVSNLHANFILNVGEATTADILALMGLMREGVYRMSGVLLEPEVKLLGAAFPWEDTRPEPAPDRSASNG